MSTTKTPSFSYNFSAENQERAEALNELKKLFYIPEFLETIKQKPLRQSQVPERVRWEAAISDLASASKRPLQCNAQHWSIHEGNLCLKLKELLRTDKPNYQEVRVILFFWTVRKKDVWMARKREAEKRVAAWKYNEAVAPKSTQFDDFLGSM